MATTNRHRQYSTLDGMRGVAALSIVVLHIPHFLLGWHLPSSFLGVDLFFILSGFVLANAYEERFGKDLGIAAFFRLRVIRLYPLYMLSIGLGIVVALLALRFGGVSVQWTSSLLAASVPLSAFMLPTPQFGETDVLYPLNPVLWSIFFELLINILYVVFWRFLKRDAALVAVVVASALALVVYGVLVGSMDAGYGWRTFAGGLARVSFSFFMGVLICRRLKKPARHSNAGALAILCAVLAAFAYDGAVVYQLLCILIAFPLVVMAAIHVEPTAFLRRWFALLGLSSYAIYVIHKPLYQLVLGASMKTLPVTPESLGPWIGIVYIVALLFFCVLLNRIYDLPVRHWLAVRWLARVRSVGVRDPVIPLR